MACEFEGVLEVKRLDRVSAAGHFEYGCTSEVGAEPLRVHRRTHEDDLDVGAFRHQILESEQQEVAFEPSLVHLVHKHMAHTPQRWVAFQSTQERARRAEEKHRVTRRHRLVSNAVAHRAPARLASLFGHARRHSDGGYSARLRAHYIARPPRFRRRLKHVMRHLCCLPAPCLPLDHYDLILV